MPHRATTLWLLLVVLLAGSTAHAQRLARGSWWDRTVAQRSQYYVIRTDLPTKLARQYARHLDRVYVEFSRRLASLPPRGPEKLDVYIFSSRADYEATLRTRWGVNARGTGGMFFVTAAGSGLAFWTEHLPQRRIQHVLQHEGFHQFAYSRFGSDLPRWLNEGIAEFFGEAMLIDDTFVLGQVTPRVIETVKGAIEREEHIAFSRLLAIDDTQWSQLVQTGRAELVYHQSWSIVHFLVYGDGGRYQQPFERYLGLINQGVPADNAFREVFGDNLGAFEERWKLYALAATPSAFVTALERIEVLAEGALELSQQGTIPGSLEELKESLRAIDFSHFVNHHGRVVEQRVDHDEAFEIPIDGLCKAVPVFDVSKPKPRLRTLRDRRREESAPTPSRIVTDNLRPRNLGIDWQRDPETDEVFYEIVVE